MDIQAVDVIEKYKVLLTDAQYKVVVLELQLKQVVDENQQLRLQVDSMSQSENSEE